LGPFWLGFCCIAKPEAHGPISDLKFRCDLPEAFTLRPQLPNPLGVHGPDWATELFAIRSCISNPRRHPLPDQLTLKLRHRTYDCEERLPQWGARIDILLLTNELDAQRPKFFERREKVFGGAGEPIKAPHHDCVELPLPGVIHEFVKFRT
jgi:hypothetical protein